MLSRYLFPFALLVAACGSDDTSDDAAATSSSTSSETSGNGSSSNDTSADDDSNETSASDGVDDTPAETSSTQGASSETSADPTESSDGGTACNPPDDNEPNDTQPEATYLGAFSDDDAEGDMVMGVLDGEADIDWFAYHGSDALGNVVDATRTIVAGDSLRLCKFIQCNDGEVDIGACPRDTEPAMDDEGNPGCCREGTRTPAFSMSAFDCPGVSDDAFVAIRVDGGVADACTPYTLAYHY